MISFPKKNFRTKHDICLKEKHLSLKIDTSTFSILYLTILTQYLWSILWVNWRKIKVVFWKHWQKLFFIQINYIEHVADSLPVSLMEIKLIKRNNCYWLQKSHIHKNFLESEKSFVCKSSCLQHNQRIYSKFNLNISIQFVEYKDLLINSYICWVIRKNISMFHR